MKGDLGFEETNGGAPVLSPKGLSDCGPQVLCIKTMWKLVDKRRFLASTNLSSPESAF